MKVLEPSLTDEDLAQLERDTFKYFADEINQEKGLVPEARSRELVPVLTLTRQSSNVYVPCPRR
jgi:hypothetical protein